MKIKLSELRKVIKEELQNMTPKLNDDYMLQMLGAAFSVPTLAPYEVKWINYRVHEDGVERSDRMDDRGLFPLGQRSKAFANINLGWIEDYMGEGITPMMVGAWLKKNGAKAVRQIK